jgi:hypothetical protein
MSAGCTTCLGGRKMAPRAMKSCNEAWVAPIMRCNLGLWRHADGLFEGISRGYARGQESGE